MFAPRLPCGEEAEDRAGQVAPVQADPDDHLVFVRRKHHHEDQADNHRDHQPDENNPKRAKEVSQDFHDNLRGKAGLRGLERLGLAVIWEFHFWVGQK